MKPLLIALLIGLCVTMTAIAQPGSGAGGYGSVGPGGGGGPTNGQTAAQVSAAVSGGAILQTNGAGQGTTLSTPTINSNLIAVQVGWNTNRALLTLTNAGTSAVNGLYYYFGVSGNLNTWTNASNFQVVSNGGSTVFWTVTNISDHLNYYTKTNSGYPVQAFAVVSGASAGPKMTFTNFVYGSNSSVAVLLIPPVYTSASPTNVAEVSTMGDDARGYPGVFPYRTLTAALLFNSNAPNIIHLGAGVFTNTAGPVGTTPPEPPAFLNGQNLIGSGRGATFIEGDLYLSQDGAATNSIKDLTLHGRILNVSSNLFIENCHLGSTNLIDVLFDGANKKTVRNSKLQSKWDVLVGQTVSDWYNCDLEAIGIDTNNVTTGVHGYVADSITLSMRIFGGTVLVSNGPPTITQQPSMWTNACINVTTQFVGRLEIYGPLLMHDSRSVAFFNPGGYTNVTGYYWDFTLGTTNAPTLYNVSSGVASQGGAGSTIPSVLGLVTNTVGGVVGVTTAMPGTWIKSASIPHSAADSSWLDSTNFFGPTNGVAVGQAVVVDSVGADGIWRLKGTNWPTGGGSQTPWAQDIDAAKFKLINPTYIILTNKDAGSADSFVKFYNYIQTGGNWNGTVFEVAGQSNGVTAASVLKANLGVFDGGGTNLLGASVITNIFTSTNTAPTSVTVGTTAPDKWVEVRDLTGNLYKMPVWTNH